MTRRKLLTTGLAAAAGASGLEIAGRLADRYGLIPPDHSGVFGVGETMTYAAQRVLTARHSAAREFRRSDVSSIAPVKGKPPESESYKRLLAGGFADWRLAVDGLVAHPASFSLTELRSFPSRTEILHQACEEGWSFIAEWTGVPLSFLLDRVGAHRNAKYVIFFAFDLQNGMPKWNSIDMADAWHTQTLLAYDMNGQELPTGHGAPLRLRIARQLGGKSTKYLTRISVADTVRDIGKGLGSSSPEAGFSWYAGI